MNTDQNGGRAIEHEWHGCARIREDPHNPRHPCSSSWWWWRFI